ncbi:FAD-dependent oxidoreductase [Streptomyces sp. ICBB 8177]|nr:FAD-dependent oxidoreductase [Streptomyces sp. ICBB 8177]
MKGVVPPRPPRSGYARRRPPATGAALWTNLRPTVRHGRVKEPARILVVGGGYVGMNAALRLRRRLGDDARVTVVSCDPYMTYQPFLAETAAGSIAPAHVVVPLRRVLAGCTVIVGDVLRIEHARRTAIAATPASRQEGGTGEIELPYDELVIACGSVSRTLPVPGLAETGIGFKTVEEAIGLRNHVLTQLDIASSTRDVEIRDAALTFVVVGGGFAGVGALGELEDMSRYATRHFHNVTAADLRWVLVEAADRILPEVGAEVADRTLRELRRRNVDVRLSTRLESCEHSIARLSDGSRLPTRTVVWTAGVKPHPLVAACDLPRTGDGALRCEATLRLEGTAHAWAAGDAAAVPDLTAAEPGTLCAPSAQHAVRQARVLADNVVATLRGEPLTEYRHAHVGSVAPLGLHKGVASLYGRRLTGYPAWLMHRAFHLSQVPTLNRKSRVVADWLLAALVKREVVALGSLETPRAEFELAAGSDRRPDV